MTVLLRPVALLLFVGGLLGAPASAQDAPVQFGLTVGLNVATLEAPAGAEVGVRQLPAGGIVAKADILGPLSAQAQLLLEQKGGVVRGKNAAIRYGATYLDLPLLFHLRVPSLGPVTPYGLAGGFGSLKLFETQRAGAQGLSLPLDTDTAFFRRTDAGVSGGIGGKISLGGERRLNLAVRYAHGLVDVARTVENPPFPDAPLPDPAETRTWSIMLRLGL